MKPFLRIVVAALFLGCSQAEVMPPSASVGDWTAFSGGPLPRLKAGTAWTGHDFVAWGGTFSNCSPTKCEGEVCTKSRDCGDGARFDPETRHWTAMSSVGAPSRRAAPITLAAGEKVFVFGGNDDGTIVSDPSNANGGSITRLYSLDDGGVYDSTADTWTAIGQAPLGPRKVAGTVWTGKEVIVWGGYAEKHAKDISDHTGWVMTDIPDDGDGPVLGKTFAEGWRFDVGASAWKAISSTGAPAASAVPVVIWTGSRMIVWDIAGGASYDLASDAWKPMSSKGAPAPRVGDVDPWIAPPYVGFWLQDRLVVIGATAATYDPEEDAWHALTVTVPSFTTATGTSGDVLLWNNPPSTDLPGWTLDVTGDRLAPIAAMPRDPKLAARYAPALAWTGKKLIVWGGGIVADRITGPAIGGAIYAPFP